MIGLGLGLLCLITPILSCTCASCAPCRRVIPDYRFIYQEMCTRFRKYTSGASWVGKFIDWQKYRLGRVQSEMRTEFKKSVMQKEE